jgi:ATP-binding cassette, subfamily B, bacterial
MKKLWKSLKRNIRNCRLLYAMNFVSQFVMVFFSVFSTFLAKVLVDALQKTLENADPVEKLIVDLISLGKGASYLEERPYILIIAVAGSGVLTALSSIVRMMIRAHALENIRRTIQYDLYTHLEKLPYPYFKSHREGDLIQTCTRDADVIRTFFINDTAQTSYVIFVGSLCFAILMSISWKLTLVSLSLMPLMFVYSFFMIKGVRKRYSVTDESEARLCERISENLYATRIVKAFNQERYEIAQFEVSLQDYSCKFIMWKKLSSFFFSSSDVFIFASRVLALLYAVYLATKSPAEITAGTVVLSYTFVNMIVWPMRSMATSLSNLGQAIASNERIEAVMDEQEEDIYSGIAPRIKGQIDFDDVSFAYFDDPSKPVLNGVSFAIKPGESVAIMGKTGSGKSTLSLLLTRLYDASKGQIRIDGTPIEEIQKHFLRTQIVPVLQDPFLFSKSIADNISVSKKSASREEIKRAAYIASVDEAISRFEKGYDTPVGEKGVTLSGGQKQRVAIARTILSGAPILIFDDSLSAVDTATDLAIRTRLKNLDTKQTLLLITHRIATAKDADLILVLDEGKIVESGTHQELLALGGIYARINEIQSSLERGEE